MYDRAVRESETPRTPTDPTQSSNETAKNRAKKKTTLRSASVQPPRLRPPRSFSKSSRRFSKPASHVQILRLHLQVDSVQQQESDLTTCRTLQATIAYVDLTGLGGLLLGQGNSYWNSSGNLWISSFRRLSQVHMRHMLLELLLVSAREGSRGANGTDVEMPGKQENLGPDQPAGGRTCTGRRNRSDSKRVIEVAKRRRRSKPAKSECQVCVRQLLRHGAARKEATCHLASWECSAPTSAQLSAPRSWLFAGSNDRATVRVNRSMSC